MRLTPDGQRYLDMAAGVAQPMPFHLRWALPWLFGHNAWAWIIASRGAVLLIALEVAALAGLHGATGTQAALAAGLFLGLPSVAFLWSAPVLVDAVGLVMALGVPLVAQAFGWEWAVVPLIVGAAVWEKVPVWAALFAWSPWPLIGLALPALRRLLWKPGATASNDPLRETLEKPLATGLAWHRGKWRDPFVMLLPWGACLAALAEPGGWLAVAAIGYGQLLVATDSVRLYQNAAPVVCIAAAFAIPQEWAVAVLVAHWFHPWRGNGV